MLPHQAHEAILGEIPASFWAEVGEGAYPNNPDASEWELVPDRRWSFEDFEDDTEPYERITLTETAGGVIEDNQPLDRFFGTAELDDDTIDADAVSKEGEYVYDTLEIMCTAAGSETRDGLTLTDQQRARLLARSVYRWFRHDWQTRPLDNFDLDGNAIADSETTYADELGPPIRVDSIPGRGPNNVTESVDADGAQFNAAIELHYVDSVLEYEYTPTDAEMDVTIQQ